MGELGVGALFVRESVVVAGSGNERTFVVLCVDKVKGKVRCRIEKAKDVCEDVFFAFRVDGSGWDLFFVEVAECTIGGASGAAELVYVLNVLRILSIDEFSDEWVSFRTKVNITWEVRFGSVGFLIWGEGTGGGGVFVNYVARVVLERDELDARLGNSVQWERESIRVGLAEFKWLVTRLVVDSEGLNDTLIFRFIDLEEFMFFGWSVGICVHTFCVGVMDSFNDEVWIVRVLLKELPFTLNADHAFCKVVANGGKGDVELHVGYGAGSRG
jgi:hypothetical protein